MGPGGRAVRCGRCGTEPIGRHRRDAGASRSPEMIEDHHGGVVPALQAVPALRPARAFADRLARADRAACGLTPDDIDRCVMEDREQDDWLAAVPVLAGPAGRYPDVICGTNTQDRHEKTGHERTAPLNAAR